MLHLFMHASMLIQFVWQYPGLPTFLKPKCIQSKKRKLHTKYWLSLIITTTTTLIPAKLILSTPQLRAIDARRRVWSHAGNNEHHGKYGNNSLYTCIGIIESREYASRFENIELTTRCILRPACWHARLSFACLSSPQHPINPCLKHNRRHICTCKLLSY